MIEKHGCIQRIRNGPLCQGGENCVGREHCKLPERTLYMLKILAGIQQPTAGVVAVPRECTIGYLPQVMILDVYKRQIQAFALPYR